MQIAGYANADYDDDKKLDPMFIILEKSDCKMQVTQWNLNYAFADNPPEYEILYYGKRSFASWKVLFIFREMLMVTEQSVV